MENSSKLQPTILVKKADGTTERITLQEFRKRKQSSIVQSPVPEPKVLEKKVTVIPPAPPRRVIPLVEEVEEREVVRPTMPAPQPPVPQPPRRVIPLVEDEELIVNNRHREEKEQAQVSPVTPVVQAETHIANTTPVTKVFESPYTHQALVDKQKSNGHSVQGGSALGERSLLDEDDSEIRVIGEKKGQLVSHTPAVPVSFSSSVSIPKDLEARTSSLILSWKKGIRDQYQFIEYAMKSPSDGGLGLSKVDATKLFAEISQTATLGAPRPHTGSIPVASMTPPAPLPTSSQKKTTVHQIPSSAPSVMQEISPARERTAVMGPIEEVESFSIEDFRRLSRVPKTAGEMLLAKFSGWKDESYLLYLQVCESWKKSLLFRLYIEKTIEAVEKNLIITAVLQNGELTYEEYLAIAEVNKKLGQMD